MMLRAQTITSFTVSECDDDCDYERVVNRISYQSFENQILHIDFGFVTNCAGINHPKASYQQDTLFIDYEDYLVEIDTIRKVDSIYNDSLTIEITEIHHIQSIILCDCYYESSFEISGLPKNPKTIILNKKPITYSPEKYEVYPVEFQIVNGDTINLTDKFGLRQGLWIMKDSKGQLLLNCTFQDDNVLEGISYQYYGNGRIKKSLEWQNGEHINYIVYDTAGNITVRKKSVYD